jgi:hypothetical protein
VQVGLAAMLVHARHSALEHRETFSTVVTWRLRDRLTRRLAEFQERECFIFFGEPGLGVQGAAAMLTIGRIWVFVRRRKTRVPRFLTRFPKAGPAHPSTRISGRGKATPPYHPEKRGATWLGERRAATIREALGRGSPSH